MKLINHLITFVILISCAPVTGAEKIVDLYSSTSTKLDEMLRSIDLDDKKTEENIVARYTPQNTGMCYDIDGVLLSRHIMTTLSGYKWVFTTPLFHPILTFDTVYKAYNSGIGAGARWINHFKANQADYLADFVQSIADNKKLIVPTAKMIKKLDKLGYPRVYGTNQGKREVEQHKKNEEFDDIFTGFQGGIAVSYEDENKVIKKPDLAYYEEVKTLPAMKDKKYLFFFDDAAENCEGAKKAGMIPIHVQNPSQFEAALVKLGILPPEEPADSATH